MANRDLPRGFCNPRSKTPTGAFNPVKLKSSGSAVIGIGSPIKPPTSGRYAAATAVADAIDYIAITGAAAVAGAEFYALKAADYQWEIQVDDNTIVDDTVIGKTYELTYGAVDAVSGLSGVELDGSSVAGLNPQVKIVEIIDRPDSDVLAANNAVLVETL